MSSDRRERSSSLSSAIFGRMTRRSDSNPDFRLVDLTDVAPGPAPPPHPHPHVSLNISDADADANADAGSSSKPTGGGEASHGHHHHHHASLTDFKQVLGLALAALGVIYGDIGTSPLYAYSTMFTNTDGDSFEPTPDDAIGALSVLIWLLLLIVCFKYVIFVLMADNHGEGGTFALAGLLMDSTRVPAAVRRTALYAAMVGAALLIGDGMLTPAISVVSAVEGIQVYAPSISQDVVIVISVAILVLLCLGQRFGTHRIGFLFGPIMIVWFFAIAALGINNLKTHDGGSVFKAFNPAEAYQFFHRRGYQGWASIGNAMLVVTGAEAMFSDLGHFGAGAVRLAWFALPLPALLLNYLGQAAYAVRFPENAGSTFYSSMPSGVLWPMIVLSTLATVIASQAIITGSFSLIRQAMSYDVCPRLSVYYTNAAMSGQIYVPSINYIMMIGAVALIAGFKKSSNILSAYGLAISMIFTITTVLLSIYMRYIRRWSWPVVLLLGLVFLTMDVNMVGANLLKVPHGGWFPLFIAVLFTLLFVIWKHGKEALHAKTSAQEKTVPQLRDLLELDGNLVRPPILAFYMCSSGDAERVPHVMTQYMARSMTVARICVFCHIKTNVYEPFCDPAKRFASEVIDENLGLYRLTVNMGFAERTHGFHRMVTEYMKLQQTIPRAAFSLVFLAGQHQVFSTAPLPSAFGSLTKFNNPLFENLGIPPDQSLMVVTNVEL